MGQFFSNQEDFHETQVSNKAGPNHKETGGTKPGLEDADEDRREEGALVEGKSGWRHGVEEDGEAAGSTFGEGDYPAEQSVS